MMTFQCNAGRAINVIFLISNMLFFDLLIQIISRKPNIDECYHLLPLPLFLPCTAFLICYIFNIYWYIKTFYAPSNVCICSQKLPQTFIFQMQISLLSFFDTYIAGGKILCQISIIYQLVPCTNNQAKIWLYADKTL